MAPLTAFPAASAAPSPCSLGMGRLGGSHLVGQPQQCWRCAPAGHRRRRRSHLQAPRAALLDPPPFDPAKLSVEYLPGGRGGAIAPGRRYTLTHNDVTGSLQLSIGREYNRRQLDGWYTRMLRDEILAEWRDTQPPVARGGGGRGGAAAVPSLHVFCHVSGEELWPAPPQLRSFIFQREMALVLDTIAHAEAAPLAAQPGLAAAPVYVHLRSDVPALDRVVEWGVLGLRASWRTARSTIMASLLSSVLGTLDEGDAAATDGTTGSWSRAAFSDASASWDGGAPGGDTCAPPWAGWEGGGDDGAAERAQRQGGQSARPPGDQPAHYSRGAEQLRGAGLGSLAAGPGQPGGPLVAGRTASAPRASAAAPPTPSSSSSSALGAVNGAVTLAADRPSLRGAGLEGMPRLPVAAAEPVPVAVSGGARQR